MPAQVGKKKHDVLRSACVPYLIGILYGTDTARNPLVLLRTVVGFQLNDTPLRENLEGPELNVAANGSKQLEQA
jgi:hypothetical protein